MINRNVFEGHLVSGRRLFWILCDIHAMHRIRPHTLRFLQSLAKNNDRTWFDAHKGEYLEAKENMVDFCQGVIDELKAHDDIETASGKKAVYRIYRDVRFSKDKSPYKVNMSAYFKRATSKLRGGYYLQIQPDGKSMVGGGFWSPEKDDLQLIRSQIALDSEPLRKALSSKKFKKHFGTMQGAQLKTAPKGYPKDHEEIDLLRYKQYLASKSFTDEEVLSEDFARLVSDHFKGLRPFFDAMSLYLTTDLNGEDLY